nr:hypothetical protein [Tanacetum cinerariifolium]
AKGPGLWWGFVAEVVGSGVESGGVAGNAGEEGLQDGGKRGCNV